MIRNTTANQAADWGPKQNVFEGEPTVPVESVTLIPYEPREARPRVCRLVSYIGWPKMSHTPLSTTHAGCLKNP
jgi:hypothetical protein